MAARTPFVPHDPLKPRYSARISESEWLKYEDVIRGCHSNGQSKKQILKYLNDEYDFHPS